MLEVDEDSRLGREMLNGGTRYRAGLVPGDEAIARMYETAIERLGEAGIEQYEISNFARSGFASRHNLRYWERRPYLGLGLDASSALDGEDSFVLRTKTTDDLKAYLDNREPAETAWLSLDRQMEEAWFLGLRLNAGVDIAVLEQEFGQERVRSGSASGRAAGGRRIGDDRWRTSAIDGAGTPAFERCVSGIPRAGSGREPGEPDRVTIYQLKRSLPEERKAAGLSGKGVCVSEYWIASGPEAWADRSATSASRSTTKGERPWLGAIPKPAVSRMRCSRS